MSERVASTGDVPEGALVRFEVQGTQIAVANVGGTYYAIDDTCSHLGCSLAEGEVDENTVVCKCHGSRFDLTNGEVMNGPARHPVSSFSVEVVGEDLMVDGPGGD